MNCFSLSLAVFSHFLQNSKQPLISQASCKMFLWIMSECWWFAFSLTDTWVTIFNTLAPLHYFNHCSAGRVGAFISPSAPWAHSNARLGASCSPCATRQFSTSRKSHPRCLEEPLWCYFPAAQESYWLIQYTSVPWWEIECAYYFRDKRIFLPHMYMVSSRPQARGRGGCYWVPGKIVEELR